MGAGETQLWGAGVSGLHTIWRWGWQRWEWQPSYNAVRDDPARLAQLEAHLGEILFNHTVVDNVF